MGRFLNADALVSAGQGLIGSNLFAYCGNNPVSRSDSGGLFWKNFMETVIDGVVSVAQKIVSVSGKDYINNQDALGIFIYK